MKIVKNQYHRLSKLALLACAVAASAACSSVPYRCPLEPGEKPSTQTACAGMHDAMNAAKKGLGGKQSVLVDDQGRIVPPELKEKRALNVIIQNDPFVEASGTPQYKAPKVFKVWTPGYVDKEGNLHDGRNSFFTTKGEWRYGSVDGDGTRGGEVAENLLRPAKATELPPGRIITDDELKARKTRVLPEGSTASVQKNAAAPDDKVALQNLSDSAQRAAASQQAARDRQVAPGVTAPSLKFTD